MIDRLPDLVDGETLADHLYTCATGKTIRAAVSLLVSLPFQLYARPDFRARYIDEDPTVDWASIRWARLAEDLATRSCVPMSSGERAAVTIACSLATLVPINLGDALTSLDQRNQQLALDAIEEAFR